MAMMSSFSSGDTANCTLQPPANAPMEFIMWMAMSRIRWKVVSDSVIAGATVMESPVWMPIGSKFSMEQMMTTLSLASRSSSSSNSFHPISALSIITSWIGEMCSARVSNSSNFAGSCTTDAPAPPSVNDDRMHSGKPNFCAASLPSRKLFAVACGAIGTPISPISWRKRSRFSVMSIASMLTPIIFTPYSSQMPISSQVMARFNAVWPPIVGSTASMSCSLSTSSMEAGSSGLR